MFLRNCITCEYIYTERIPHLCIPLVSVEVRTHNNYFYLPTPKRYCLPHTKSILCLRQVLDPVSAFVLVDVQNDFISGSLSISNCPAKHNGEEVVPVINDVLSEAEFDVVVYTLDWHPSNHISFINNVKDRTLHSSSKVSVMEITTEQGSQIS